MGFEISGSVVCVPSDKEIRDEILKEAHRSTYTIHPGCTKMYIDLKTLLVAEYEEGCLAPCGSVPSMPTCQGGISTSGE